MSRLSKTMELDRLGIERLPVKEEVKVWLRQLVNTLEEKYQLIRDYAESASLTLISNDGNWRIIINGNNLEFQRKESGTWTKKGAITK